MRVLHNKVLVKKDEPKERTVGGIVIPGNVDSKTVRGKVVAVGFGHLLPSGEVRPLAVRAGDTVQWRSQAGSEIDVDGEKLTILVDHEIDVVLNEPNMS